MLISYGLSVWGKIVNQDISDAMVIEIYAKQFNWTARYAGSDNELGRADVRFVGGRNELGVISENTHKGQIEDIENKISISVLFYKFFISFFVLIDIKSSLINAQDIL